MVELSGIDQLLVCTDTVLRKNLDTKEKHSSFVIMDIGLEVNTDKPNICCCFINRMPGQNLNIKVGNKSF